MDAKSRADFINSVAGGQAVPCPTCGTANSPTSKFCSSCGTKLTVQSEKKDAPAFAPVPDAAAQAPNTGEPTRQTDGNTAAPAEHASAFADGLPAWDIVPPQVLVRRRGSQ